VVPDQRILEAYFERRAQLYEQVGENQAGFLARLWWRPLTLYRRLTIEALQGSPCRSVLEIGCGTGHLATALAARGFDVLGLDLSGSMIAIARRRAEELRLVGQARFQVADFDHWTPDSPEVVDFVVALATFDYCRAPEEWLSRIGRLGKELIATFPMPSAWRGTLRAMNASLSGGFRIRTYREPALLALLEQTGYSIHRSTRIGSTLWIHARRR
jgi:SAM-dependent methyltransferase